MGLWPVEIFVAEIDFRRPNLTTKVDPHAVRVKQKFISKHKTVIVVFSDERVNIVKNQRFYRQSLAA